MNTKINKIKGLARLVLVPGSIWKTFQDIHKEETKGFTTQPERDLYNELRTNSDAAAINLEVLRIGAYIVTASYILYHIVK